VDDYQPKSGRLLRSAFCAAESQPSLSPRGLTAERVLIHADTAVHPDMLNSRFGYVSISRASHEAILFTDDMAKLSPQLAADGSKTSALEINAAASVSRGIAMR
jgi:hypothetical protein